MRVRTVSKQGWAEDATNCKKCKVPAFGGMVIIMIIQIQIQTYTYSIKLNVHAQYIMRYHAASEARCKMCKMSFMINANLKLMCVLIAYSLNGKR